MTQYLHIKNWKKFQHYKGRCPPWVKLHFEILTSADWVALADASKLVMVACMVVASRHDGRVPNDAAYIKRVAYLDECDLAPLISCGFLSETLADASAEEQPLAPTPPESESEREKKEKKVFRRVAKATAPNVEFEEFWKAYPRREGDNPKAPARKLFEAAVKQGADPKAIIAGVKAACARNQDKIGTPYIPQAVKWLRDRRWEDYAGANGAPTPQPNDVARYLA